jgi:hypothetical protein
VEVYPAFAQAAALCPFHSCSLYAAPQAVLVLPTFCPPFACHKIGGVDCRSEYRNNKSETTFNSSNLPYTSGYHPKAKHRSPAAPSRPPAPTSNQGSSPTATAQFSAFPSDGPGFAGEKKAPTACRPRLPTVMMSWFKKIYEALISLFWYVACRLAFSTHPPYPPMRRPACHSPLLCNNIFADDENTIRRC